MKLQYLTTTLLASTALVCSSQMVFADCVKTGDDFVCSGSSSGTVELDKKRATATVEEDAQLEASGDAIKSRKKDVVITVDGTVTGGDEGIQARGDDTRITVNGTVIGADNAVDVKESDNTMLTNTGTITGLGRKGVKADASTNFTLINASDATLIGKTEAIEAGDHATINNESGASIIGQTDDAVNIGDGGTVNNAGLIMAYDDGIDLDSGTINNTGLISASDGDGIDVDASSEGGVMVNNFGTISGKAGIRVEDGSTDEANTQNHIILNFGSIVGTSGTAIHLSSGNDIVMNFGSIVGDVALGGGNDAFDMSNVPLSTSLTLDGGDGQNALVNFTSRLIGATFVDDALVLSYDTQGVGSADVLVTARNFNFFDTGSAVYSASQVVALYGAAPSEVPLPASVLLLGGALAGFGALRRRS